jgi:AcrR family transcriptional regulator
VPSIHSVEPRRHDRRRARHEATKQEILDAAWAMVRAGGLNALSLRALAHDLDMEPQSLYTYFASKHAVYDHLFAAGNRELLARFGRLEPGDDPRQVLGAIAHLFVSFATDEPARYELLFMRTVPDFEPSPGSYALAVDVFSKARSALADVGLDADADFDLWTALVAGLASQQLANDRHGDRYIRLIDDAVAMFADHVFGMQPAEKVNTGGGGGGALGGIRTHATGSGGRCSIP